MSSEKHSGMHKKIPPRRDAWIEGFLTGIGCDTDSGKIVLRSGVVRGSASAEKPPPAEIVFYQDARGGISYRRRDVFLTGSTLPEVTLYLRRMGLRERTKGQG